MIMVSRAVCRSFPRYGSKNGFLVGLILPVRPGGHSVENSRPVGTAITVSVGGGGSIGTGVAVFGGRGVLVGTGGSVLVGSGVLVG